MGRRFKILPFSAELMCQIIEDLLTGEEITVRKKGKSYLVRVKGNFPPRDALVTGVFYDDYKACLVYRIESAEFESVPEGVVIGSLEPVIFERVEINSARR